MLNLLASALWGAIVKIMTSLASERFMIWALFRVGEGIVKSTKTKEDDAWLEKIKKTHFKETKKLK